MKKPSEVDIVVGKNIYRVRRFVGVSQSVLAESLGVSFQQVQKYEKGTNRISVGKLVEVAHALGVPVETLLKGAEEARESVVPFEALTTGNIKLARELGKIESVEIQRALRALIKALARNEQDSEQADSP